MERIVIPPYDEYDLSTFVRHGDTISFGHVGGYVDDSGTPIETVEGQMHRILDNLETLLAEIGFDLSNVAKLRVILRDIADFHEMHAVWTDRFEQGAYPARTVITSAFVDEAIRVQVEGVAYAHHD